MIDPRFYVTSEPKLASVLADISGATLGGEDRLIKEPASAQSAGQSEICFSADRKRSASIVSETAAACFIEEAYASCLPQNVVPIYSNFPRLHFTIAATALVARRRWGRQPLPVDESAIIADDVEIGHGAVVCADASIGSGSRIGPNSVIGPGVSIGKDCDIGASTTIECSVLGDRVTIQSNTVIGGTGFGVIAGPDGPVDVPHFGRVLIGDNVSIGTNACVDRGVFDDTVIGSGTKIDNLVQIAHNVELGRYCIIAAFGGISGSVTVGDGAQLGGRVGIADHNHIGSGARIAADAAVMRDIPDGETWAGTPAKPIKQMLREVAWVTKNARSGQRSGD